MIRENDQGLVAASAKFANAFGVFYKWTREKFYFDEIYLFVARKIFFKNVAAPIAFFDKKFVDGTMEGIGNKTVVISEKVKSIQSGRVQDYAFGLIAGFVVIAFVFIYLWFV